MAIMDQPTIEYIVSLLKNIDYGSIAITIYDGQIKQVDSTEKIRFK